MKTLKHLIGPLEEQLLKSVVSQGPIIIIDIDGVFGLAGDL